MKCPHCGNELKEGALFCGFCGKPTPRTPSEKAPTPLPLEEKSEAVESAAPAEVLEETPTPLPAEEKSEAVETAAEIKQDAPKDKPKKKRTALKCLLVFLLIAFVGGGVLGYLTVNDIISFDWLMPDDGFKWNDYSDGWSKTPEAEDSTDDKEDGKGEDGEIAPPAEEEGETDLPSETPPAEDEQPNDNLSHYAKYVGDALVLVDDKAHVWEETSISNIFENAKAMSELSGYSIMIVATSDMFNMTSQGFAEQYFAYQLTANKEETELSADGYLFLLNLADQESYLFPSGKAADLYDEAAMNTLFGEISSLLNDGQYEAAVNKLIEKTIY